MSTWAVSISRVDADGGGFNDNWAWIEADNELEAINKAIMRSLQSAVDAGTHLVSIHVGTPRKEVKP